MEKLQEEILSAIKGFWQQQKLTREDYYGDMAKKADQKQLLLRAKEKAAMLTNVNYQSNTVSMAIKKKSVAGTGEVELI